MVDLTAAAALATPIFFMTAALLVFAVRPEGTVNRVAGGFLFLSGAADLMWFFMWYGEYETSLRYAQVATWYDFGRLFFLFYLLHVLYPSPRYGLWRGIALGSAAVVILGFLAVFVLDPTLFVERMSDSSRNLPIDGPMGAPTALVSWGALMVAVVVSAGVAASSSRSKMERQQAGTVGGAFLLVTLYSGFQHLTAWPLWLLGSAELDVSRAVELSGSVMLLVVSLVALPRILVSLEPGMRKVLSVLLVIAVVGSLVIPVSAVTSLLGGPSRPAWWGDLRRFIVIASAGILAVAFMRYGLAGFGEQARRRIAILAHASLLVVIFLLPAMIVLAVLGGGTVVTVAGFMTLFVMGVTFAPVPLRAARSGVMRMVMVDPEGDAAMAERTRRYRSALEHRLEHTGGLPEHVDPALSRLRVELGLSDDDHVRIARLLKPNGGAREVHPPLLGRYRVVKEIGRGAFAVALLAVDESTGREVVLKRYHRKDLREEALKEARSLTRVKHTRVVPLLAVEETHEEVFLVLAHVSGGSLQELIERTGAMDARRAVRLTLNLLEGLGALHGVGLAHRDVKPANLLLDEEDRVLLADLGSTRNVVEQAKAGTLTANPMVGSFATVAPEVLRGERAQVVADVYAAGAVLFKLLTGEDYVELDAQSPVKLMQAVLTGPVRLPHPRVPSSLEPVLRRALAKAPEARYTDAGAMALALESAAEADLGPLDA